MRRIEGSIESNGGQARRYVMNSLEEFRCGTSTGEKDSLEDFREAYFNGMPEGGTRMPENQRRMLSNSCQEKFDQHL